MMLSNRINCEGREGGFSSGDWSPSGIGKAVLSVIISVILWEWNRIYAIIEILRFKVKMSILS